MIFLSLTLPVHNEEDIIEKIVEEINTKSKTSPAKVEVGVENQEARE